MTATYYQKHKKRFGKKQVIDIKILLKKKKRPKKGFSQISKYF